MLVIKEKYLKVMAQALLEVIMVEVMVFMLQILVVQAMVFLLQVAGQLI
mgnify:CR=1 FL=1